MNQRRILVVSAGTSTPSSTRLLADQLLAGVQAAAPEQGLSLTADTVELRDHAHGLIDHLLTGFASPAVEALLQQVAAADALILVAPVYTTSYSALFKAFVDVLERQHLQGKPILLGATAGTARHSLVIDYAMRPLLTYHQAEPVPTGVFAASTDWSGGDQVAPLSARIARAAGEFVTALAAKPARAATVDEYDPASYGGSDFMARLLGTSPAEPDSPAAP